MRNHAQSRAIKSTQEQSPVEGVEGHRGSGRLGGPTATQHGVIGEIVGARRRFRHEEERHVCMHPIPQSDQQGSHLVRLHRERIDDRNQVQRGAVPYSRNLEAAPLCSTAFQIRAEYQPARMRPAPVGMQIRRRLGIPHALLEDSYLIRVGGGPSEAISMQALAIPIAVHAYHPRQRMTEAIRGNAYHPRQLGRL